MKRLSILISLLLPVLLFGQEEKTTEPDVMYMTVYMKPELSKIEQFRQAMGKHNKTYHTSDPFKVYVWAIQNGPHTGSLVYVMGPLTYTESENRKAGEAHDMDWDKNVLTNVKYAGNLEYWKRKADFSYAPEGWQNSGKMEVWIMDIARGEYYRFRELRKKLLEVYKEKKYDDRTISFYWNEFPNTKQGRDVAIVFGVKSWSLFDEDSNFKNDYIEVHGEGSWNTFMEEWTDVVVGIDRELREFVPALSSDM